MSARIFHRNEIRLRSRTGETLILVLALVSISMPLFVSSDESSAGPISGRSARGGEYEPSYNRSYDYLSHSERERASEALRSEFGLDRWDQLRKAMEQDRQTKIEFESFTVKPPKMELKPSKFSLRDTFRKTSRLSSLHSFFEEGFRETVSNLADNGKSVKEGEQDLLKDVLHKSFESSSTKNTEKRPRGMNENLLMDTALREFSKDMKDAPPELMMSRDPNFDLRLKK